MSFPFYSQFVLSAVYATLLYARSFIHASVFFLLAHRAIFVLSYEFSCVPWSRPRCMILFTVVQTGLCEIY
jgi:hypothetical protein